MKNLKLVLLAGMLSCIVIVSCRKEIFNSSFDEQAFFQNTSNDKLTSWAAKNLKKQNNIVSISRKIFTMNLAVQNGTAA